MWYEENESMTLTWFCVKWHYYKYYNNIRIKNLFQVNLNIV